MKRSVVLEAVKHTPPKTAAKRKDGFFDLAFELRHVFHHGYIEVHERPPKKGTNPFFDEYANLLASGTKELRWDPGIARGDHKTSESQKLGRIFARAYLSLHGYRWFADVKELMKSPEHGWSVARPKKGDMPDWVIGGAKKFAIAEAKGTHSSVHAKSRILAKAWRPQVGNIEARKDGGVRKLKTWIIATRWVNEQQTQTEPKMYVEDPDPPDDQTVREDEEPSLSLWIARVHTLRNLARLAQREVAERVAAGVALRDGPKARPITWRCTAPGLDKLRFIGRPIGDAPFGGTLPFGMFDWRFLRELYPVSPSDLQDWERRNRLMAAWFDSELDSIWFDGLAVPIVKDLVADAPPAFRWT